LKWLAVGSLYTVAFLPYLFTSAPVDRLFLMGYVTGMVVSLLIPFRGAGASLNSTKFFRGCFSAVAAIIFFSIFLVPISVLLNLDELKYVGALWIMFSLIPIVGSPLRLSRLGSRLREKGLEGVGSKGDPQASLDHFALDFSIQAWFRHSTFSFVILASLGLYYYGWWLLGVAALLLYSVSIIVLAAIVLRLQVRHLLQPYELSDVMRRMESDYPVKKIFDFLNLPSPRATLVIASMLFFAIFAGLVTNPLGGENLPVFLAVAVIFAVALLVYLETSRSPPKR